ncbi:MAG TPA: histidine kinase [Pyrinomonadaceae bacterium]|nr:histidine kinase [Pyrinomonadaceae bacterium]
MRSLDSKHGEVVVLDDPESRRSWLVKWGLIWSFWTLLGLLYTSQLYVGMRGHNHSFWRMLAWQLLGCWYFWPLATPLILWLGRHFPVERHSWKRNLPVHVAAGTILGGLHSILVGFSTVWFQPYDAMSDSRPFWDSFWDRFVSEYHLELIAYGMIVGVGYAFDYYARFREREFRASQLEAQLAQAQLQALKMQLHPHFLFNTLNAIAGLIRDRKDKAAVNMLAGLSDLLRHTLENAGKQEIPLREELDFLELYLDIQQMRFSDRLTVKMEVAPETLNASVPNLILQPLVENAIRHGIAARVSSGLVAVSARRENGLLQLKVADDGPGLKRDWRMEDGGGIGLSNTRERLKQLYGREHRFEVRNREGGGVEATLLIPWRVSAGEA